MATKLAVSLAIALCACASAGGQGDPPGYVQKDYAELTALMQGRWDNDRHVFFAEDAGLDTTALAPRQHLVIQPVDGETGEITLHAVRTPEGEAPIALLHRFRLNPETNGIEQVSAPATGEGAPAPCIVDWTREGAGFTGRARAEVCGWMFGPAEAGEDAARLVLSEEDFWVVTSTREARFRRARPFECWVGVLRGAEHGDSGEGLEDWFFTRDVRLHDQYGEAVVETDETPPRRVHLRLRNVDWPYGGNRASLSFYVHDRGAERATSYAWGEYDAERIGINLRWIQASCTHTPDILFEDF